jgi:PAS domain S-box-containing protein
VDEERLELALRASGLGVYEWDAARQSLFIDRRVAELTGLPPGETPAPGGLPFERWMSPEEAAEMRRRLDKGIGQGDSFKFDVRMQRPDTGQTVWLWVSIAARFDTSGGLLGVTGMVGDITAYKVEEDERQALIAEVDHRVKNMLAAVQALAYQTAKRTTSLDAFLDTFSGRLKALGSANELLTAARWRGAAVEHVASAELGALAPRQTRWEGPELFLTPRAANALALALHELATNAVKYGALSVESGHIDVRWRGLPDGGFELNWTESGGPTVAAPARRGFGTTLLDQVTGRELNGEAVVDYRPSGVRARLVAGPAAVTQRPETTPHVPAPKPADAAAARAPRSLNGSRVLIVEDAVLLALELETGLSEAGAEVVGPAYELEEAMALLDRPIDAAVLDANLNGRSVTPVAEALARRNVPFVFATGYGETGGAPGGFEAPVIRKPYDVTQVAAAVAELLARP